MGPVNEELVVLFDELKKSKRDKEQSLDLLQEILSSIINNNIASDQYKNIGLMFGAYISKIRSGIHSS